MRQAKNITLKKHPRPLNIIVAVDEHGGFAKDGKIPWHFPDDFKRFSEITMDGICIMGRRTYEDILEIKKQRTSDTNPTELLPGRRSLVLSKQKLYPSYSDHYFSLPEAIKSIEAGDKKIFILGGEKLFIESFPLVNRIYMTIVKGAPYGCDRFFPLKLLDEEFKIEKGQQTDELWWVEYIRTKS